jgi:hypothetical protein
MAKRQHQPTGTTTTRASMRWAALAMLAAVGCGGPYDSAVTGVVTLDNEPLPTGVVSFSPQGQGAMANGQIRSDGTYQLWTGREEGLASGEYVVTVIATDSTGDRGKDGGPPPMGKLISPAWYQNPATSGLTFTVAPGDNEINLPLTKTPPPGYKPPAGRR